MNRVAAFALRRKNSILSMSEKMFCPPQPLRFWITPACAGKRFPDLKPPAHRGDHPRMCGEKVPITCVPKYALGSPPHVRGKEKGRRDGCDHQRITPAYAGKSVSRRPRWTHTGDHPRVCGEKAAICTASGKVLGSPPRVRGKAGRQLGIGGLVGITPAYAGKRNIRLSGSARRRDHPRVCGEKYFRQCSQFREWGSPPRVRGKVPSSI